jgi:hypothetical protein
MMMSSHYYIIALLPQFHPHFNMAQLPSYHRQICEFFASPEGQVLVQEHSAEVIPSAGVTVSALVTNFVHLNDANVANFNQIIVAMDGGLIHAGQDIHQWLREHWGELMVIIGAFIVLLVACARR